MNEYIMTPDMREDTRFKNHILELPCGLYWRGNTSKPVKTARSAALLSLNEARAMQAKYKGCIVREAPKSRNV